LAKRGHDVTVYTTDVKDFDSRLETSFNDIVDGIRVYRFRNISLTLVKKLKLFITSSFISYVKENLERFDIICMNIIRFKT